MEAKASEAMDIETTDANPEPQRRGCISLACCGIFFLILILLNFLVLVPIVTDAVKAGFRINDSRARDDMGDDINITNIIYKTFWPGCGPGEDISRFDTCKSCFAADLPKKMQTQMDANGGSLVTYPSRVEEGIENVSLRGWLLPAVSSPATAPRIVIQHGYNSNSNKYRAINMQFHLRNLGYTVLLNNFRDHGYSDNTTTRITEFGNGYPYDLLGAWDYLLNDPDGKLGGPIDASKVGLFGFSMGAFTTNNAFGLESRVPAAWVDSPPFSPQGATEFFVSQQVGRLLTALVFPQVWPRVFQWAKDNNIDWDKNYPEKTMRLGPVTARPLMVTSNPNDDVVPLSEVQRLRTYLESHTDKYSVEHFETKADCSETWHCVGPVSEEEVYVSNLCRFWKKAFAEDVTICDTPAPVATHVA